ncbi:hypothetical protein ETU08_00545 [Apibacter muscae]|uniref:hypothetical protein n=1 Tax=Apibacter muscae TaxID=2509004 RepID=UPI0011AC4E1E|nr:hypothetical protein [Apibacter muscae]TWP31585.1 hypothetical protein ETU08_00545 [Apibacter muscae]
MNTTELKKRIKKNVDQADERMLRLINAMFESEQSSSPVPQWVYDEIEEQKEQIQNGEIKLSEWKEVKQRLKEKYAI